MKKTIILIILLNANNIIAKENEIGLSTKVNNLKLEAVYKKSLTGDETDLKTYFRSGNKIGVNLTYLFDDDSTQEITDINNNDYNKISVNKNFAVNSENYKLNHTDGLKNNIEKLSRGTNYIKLSTKKESFITKTNNQIKTVGIFTKFAKKLEEKYGKIADSNITRENPNKNEKIIIFFNKEEKNNEGR